MATQYMQIYIFCLKLNFLFEIWSTKAFYASVQMFGFELFNILFQPIIL